MINTAENDLILKIDKVTVSFTSKKGLPHKAVNNVSLQLHRGDSIAVVGESGSGKTTLMRAVMGLVPRESGAIFLLGTDTGKLPAENFNRLRRMCGYIPQDPYGAIPPGLTVMESVIEPAIIAASPLTKSERAERAAGLLAELGLKDERILASRAVSLSGGQRQRVEIARALMLSPKLLLCDEPTSMQDVSTRGEIIEVLERRTKLGMSLIFVTHDLLLAGRAAAKIAVMKDGMVCEEGVAAEVLSHPQNPYTCSLLDAVPKLSWD